MASFYSKPAEYGTYTQPINLEMVNFVMASRQEKYDYNLAKMESKIADQLGNLDLARAQDKEYFLNRASDIIGGMGDISRLDWSKNGVTRQVDDQINKIVDERVLKDVISTKNYRAFQNTLKEKQDAGDGSYNAINAAYAMETQGVNAWLKGEKDSQGSISYQDYVDIPTQLKDLSENLEKYARDIKTFTDPTGQRRYMTTEGKVLTSTQVRAIAEQLLTGPAKEQMKINGWANWDRGVRSTQEIIKDFDSVANKKIEKYKGQIAAIDLQMEELGDGDKAQIDKLQAQKDALEDAMTQNQSKFDGWRESGNKASMTTYLENEAVLGRFGDTFAINDVKKTLVDNRYELAKFQEELKRETQRLKDLRDLQKKAMEEKESPYQIITPTQEVPDADRAAELDREVIRYNEGYDNTLSGVYNSLPAKTKSNLDAAWEASDKSMDKQDFIYAKIMGTGKNKGLGTASQKQQILTAKLRRDKALDLRSEARDYAFNVIETSNMEEIIEQAINDDWQSSFGFANKNDFKMLDPNGEVVSVEQYFRSRNVTSKEDLKKNPQVMKDFLKAMYTERILSQGVSAEVAAVLTGASMGLPGGGFAVAPGAGGEDQTGIFRDRLIKLFDGDEAAADAHIAKTQRADLGPNKIGDYVEGFFKNIPATGQFIVDDKILEDNWFNRTFDEDRINTEVGKYLNQNQLTATTNQVIVSKDSPQGTKLMEVLSSETALMEGLPGNVTTAKDQPMTLQDLGNGMVRVYVKVKGEEGEIMTRTTTLPVSNLPDQIEQEVRFGEQRAVIDAQNMEATEGRAIYYDDTDDRGIAGFAQLGRQTFQQAGSIATKGGVTSNAFYQFQPIMGSQEQPTKLGAAVKNMINSDNLVAEIVKDEESGFFRNKISYIDPITEKKVGLHVYSAPIPPEEYERQYFNTQLAPQLLVTQFLQTTLTDVLARGGQLTPQAQKIIDVYGG